MNSKPQTTPEHVSKTFRTGKVISSVNGASLTGEICLTHHQDMIFILAPQEPFVIPEGPEPLVDKLSAKEEPALDTELESYVRLSRLPAELRAQIRDHLATKR